MKYLPIETAPQDGTQFLFDAQELEAGWSIGFFENGVLLSAWNGKPVVNTKPKYWTPLPEAIIT
jgi:hypothetical protein